MLVTFFWFVVVGGLVVEIYTSGQGLILAWHVNLVNLHHIKPDWFCVCLMEEGRCVTKYDEEQAPGPLTNMIQQFICLWKSVSVLNRSATSIGVRRLPLVYEFKALHWTHLEIYAAGRNAHLFCIFIYSQGSGLLWICTHLLVASEGFKGRERSLEGSSSQSLLLHTLSH